MRTLEALMVEASTLKVCLVEVFTDSSLEVELVEPLRFSGASFIKGKIVFFFFSRFKKKVVKLVKTFDLATI